MAEGGDALRVSARIPSSHFRVSTLVQVLWTSTCPPLLETRGHHFEKNSSRRSPAPKSTQTRSSAGSAGSTVWNCQASSTCSRRWSLCRRGPARLGAGRGPGGRGRGRGGRWRTRPSSAAAATTWSAVVCSARAGSREGPSRGPRPNKLPSESGFRKYRYA
jgi:hypothetical protein